jgi:hypothetical protein
MASLETPTGDSITSKLQDNTQAYGLPEVTKDLMDAHAHRPGLFAQDLAKVNEGIEHLMPGLDIVGIDGKDLLARDEQNQTFLVDASNPENRKPVSTETTEQAIGDNGRVAQLAEDGSGKYTVVGGDSCWRIADDILTAQGVAEPTDNQIANYIKELEQHNGRSFSSLQIGDEINIPTMVQGSEETAFAEAADNTDAPGGFTPLPTDAEGIDNLIDGMTAEKFMPGEVRPGPTVEAAAALEAEKAAEKAILDARLQAAGAEPAEKIAADLEAFRNGTYVNPAAVSESAEVPAEIPAEVPAELSPVVLPAELPETYNPVAEELMLMSSVSNMNVGMQKALTLANRAGEADPSLTLAEVETALQQPDLEANQRVGLNLIASNFDILKGEDGTVRKSAFEKWGEMRKREIAAIDMRVNGYSITPSLQETLEIPSFDDLFEFN